MITKTSEQGSTLIENVITELRDREKDIRKAKPIKENAIGKSISNLRSRENDATGMQNVIDKAMDKVLATLVKAQQDIIELEFSKEISMVCEQKEVNEKNIRKITGWQ